MARRKDPIVPGRGEGGRDGRVPGYKKAARREIPNAVEVLDPFHIVRLAGDRLTAVRCRLQRERTGRRGTRDDPLSRGRRVLPTTETLRTDKQRERAALLLDDPANQALKLAHGAYQRIIRCYAQEDRKKGRGMMAELIEALNARGAAPGCPELAPPPGTHPATPHAGHPRVLRPGTQRQRAHRGHQRQARDPQGHRPQLPQLDNYITRSLLHTGSFRHTIQTHL